MLPIVRYPRNVEITPFALDNAKAAANPYKLFDGGGLHLLTKPNGSKLWRFRYRSAGVEKLMALGSYPETGLAAAREKYREARKLLEAGSDPLVQKKLDRLAAEKAQRNTFKHLAEEHLANMKANGASPTTVEKHRWLLEDVARSIAHRQIATITAACWSRSATCHRRKPKPPTTQACKNLPNLPPD